MAGKYVFSTCTASQKYAVYSKVPGRDMPVMEGYVLIHGGANLPTKQLVTPKGVMTHITDEEFEMLQRCPVFKTHVDGGFITVEDVAYDLEDVVGNMEPRDSSAPMIPADFEEADLKPPTTGSVRDDDFATVRATQRPAQATGKKDKGEKPKATRRRRGGASTESAAG